LASEFYADTNLIVRFLANDDPFQSPVALEVIKKAINGDITLILTPQIITECCWVLGSKRYGYDPTIIASNLKKIISSPGIKAEEKEIVLKALDAYEILNVDFTDAYLSVLAHKNGKSVVTWNKKHFKRLPAEFYSPDELTS
jgi:predicted nucleic-acid-binding protein